MSIRRNTGEGNAFTLLFSRIQGIYLITECPLFRIKGNRTKAVFHFLISIRHRFCLGCTEIKCLSISRKCWKRFKCLIRKQGWRRNQFMFLRIVDDYIRFLIIDFNPIPVIRMKELFRDIRRKSHKSSFGMPGRIYQRRYGFRCFGIEFLNRSVFYQIGST